MAEKSIPENTPESQVKTCVDCGVVKPCNEFWNLQDHCKRCSAKRAKRKYCLNNPEKRKKSCAKFRRANRDDLRIKGRTYSRNHKQESRDYYEGNKEEIKAKRKEYAVSNPKKIKERGRKYYSENKEMLDLKNRLWRESNPEKHRLMVNRANQKKRSTQKGLLSGRMSCNVRQSLKGNKKGRHWEDLVGYTLTKLIKRLKRTLPPGYTWQDYIDGKLHLDHIIPISVFNFTDSNQIDFKKCWALKNLQLLPASENISKGNKLDKPFQPSLGF
jgi:hypothetical protein